MVVMVDSGGSVGDGSGGGSDNHLVQFRSIKLLPAICA